MLDVCSSEVVSSYLLSPHSFFSLPCLSVKDRSKESFDIDAFCWSAAAELSRLFALLVTTQIFCLEVFYANLDAVLLTPIVTSI